jgi:hypothetical protein
MTKPTKIPTAMQEKYNSISKETDSFCKQHLNNEYKQLAHTVIATLCRKRPSPLLTGKDKTWAAGVIHALGTVNFLFDKSQTPHCTVSDIASYFGIATSTGQNKSKEIRDLLNMLPFSPEWMLPSRIEKSPSVWFIKVNGFIVDARSMPLDVQEIACKKGLIPYIPAKKA